MINVTLLYNVTCNQSNNVSCNFVTGVKLINIRKNWVREMPTVRINDKRYRELEKKAVDATIKSQKPVPVSAVINSLIDEKLKEITPDLVLKNIMESGK